MLGVILTLFYFSKISFCVEGVCCYAHILTPLPVLAVSVLRCIGRGNFGDGCIRSGPTEEMAFDRWYVISFKVMGIAS
jgi:hypothetical protein